jgi:RNA polymerase sigma-70 factor (ECF subfamily)
VFTLTPTFVETEISETRSLLDQARAGDTEAFGEICRIHGTRLLRQAMTLCGNATLAEDLAQETLVEAWKCLRRYDGQCRFFTWLYAILLNRHHNLLRQKRPLPFSAFARQDRDEFQKNFTNLVDHGSLPDEAAQLHERAAQVRACIQALPAKQQQVIYLRFYADDSLEGIAAALDCSVGTVKSRLFHALDRLRGMNALNTGFMDSGTKDRPL